MAEARNQELGREKSNKRNKSRLTDILILALGGMGLVIGGFAAYDVLPVNQKTREELMKVAGWGMIVPFY